MPFGITIISTNEYLPEEIIQQNLSEKYWYDETGELCLTANVLDSEKNIKELIAFLFQNNSETKEICRNANTYVLDLSSNRKSLVDFDYIEQNYSNWLETTGRSTSMNEYGMLIDFRGHVKQGAKMKYLLMIIRMKESLPNNNAVL